MFNETRKESGTGALTIYTWEIISRTLGAPKIEVLAESGTDARFCSDKSYGQEARQIKMGAVQATHDSGELGTAKIGQSRASRRYFSST